MIVRVPASSANIGPGFDALGMALSLHLELEIGDTVTESNIDERHPASVAFRAAGGTGPLAVRCPIPSGRGLGFSGAARVAGLVGAVAQRRKAVVLDDDELAEVLATATTLEGHADNVAASLIGGVVATGSGLVVSVPLGLDPVVLVWVPQAHTSTDSSRAGLATHVQRSDAVFNIAHTAMLVAALAAGDVRVLRTVTQDRLHQHERFARSPTSRAAFEAGLEAGAWCGWLSGSGPTVAFLCSSDMLEAVSAALPDEGHVKELRIDHAGAVIEE